jgi:integrase
VPANETVNAEKNAFGSRSNKNRVSRLWPALFTCISIGLRRGEVLAPQWFHIRFDTGEFRVRQTLTASRKGLFRLKPHAKTNAGNRDILMPPSLIRVLAAHQVTQRFECEALGLPFSENDFVFATIERTHPHPDNLARALDALLEWSEPGVLIRKKGDVETHLTLEQRLKAISVPLRPALRQVLQAGDVLPDISPHDLRHTCATLWLRARRPIEVVSRDLGHEKPNVTYRTYRHVLPSEREQNVMDLFAPQSSDIVNALVTSAILRDLGVDHASTTPTEKSDSEPKLEEPQ